MICLANCSFYFSDKPILEVSHMVVIEFDLYKTCMYNIIYFSCLIFTCNKSLTLNIFRMLPNQSLILQLCWCVGLLAELKMNSFLHSSVSSPWH